MIPLHECAHVYGTGLCTNSETSKKRQGNRMFTGRECEPKFPRAMFQ